MRKLATSLPCFLMLNFLLLSTFQLLAQENPQPIVNRAQGFAISAPLRESASLPAQTSFSFPVSKASSPASNFSVGLNFLGIGNGFPGYQVNDWHPIPSLAVGDTQVVQWAKDSYVVFDKAT